MKYLLYVSIRGFPRVLVDGIVQFIEPAERVAAYSFTIFTTEDPSNEAIECVDGQDPAVDVDDRFNAVVR